MIKTVTYTKYRTVRKKNVEPLYHKKVWYLFGIIPIKVQRFPLEEHERPIEWNY